MLTAMPLIAQQEGSPEMPQAASDPQGPRTAYQRLLISFNGGETSAYMTRRTLNNPVLHAR